MRHRLFQHLEPFATHRSVVAGEACDVAAGMGETGNETGADRIADLGKHDRHLLLHWLQQSNCEIAERHDDIGRECKQFRSSRPHLLRSACPPAHFDARVAIPGPAQLFNPPKKGGKVSFTLLGRSDAHQHRDCAASVSLQRVGGEWPNCRGAKSSKKRPPAHSITSSAVASSIGGISRPSVFAVLRLIAKLNLVGCSKGSSAGLAPSRIFFNSPATPRIASLGSEE